MRNNFLLFIILSSSSFNCSSQKMMNLQNQNSSSAITWKANGGRFGDNLLSYTRSKWISYKFNIPLLYVPFTYSDQLMLHEQEKIYTEKCKSLFSSITNLPFESEYQIIPEANTLYISYWKTPINIDWNDNVFMEELKKNILPRHPLSKLFIPKRCISIAAHVRNGGSFSGDHEKERERCPLRFVPDEFFIAQIERLADIFKEERLYVYIFTDHQQPAKLKRKFKKALNNPRITFDYRHAENDHDANVLEDFFSMMNFDCLIRPGSHYSTFVQHLGKSRIVIFPKSVRKNAHKKSVIDVINVQTRNYIGDQWQTEEIEIA